MCINCMGRGSAFCDMEVRTRVAGLIQYLSHDEVFTLAERLGGFLNAHRISLATLVSYVVCKVSFALANVLQGKERKMIRDHVS